MISYEIRNLVSVVLFWKVNIKSSQRIADTFSQIFEPPGSAGGQEFVWQFVCLETMLVKLIHLLIKYKYIWCMTSFMEITRIEGKTAAKIWVIKNAFSNDVFVRGKGV